MLTYRWRHYRKEPFDLLGIDDPECTKSLAPVSYQIQGYHSSMPGGEARAGGGSTRCPDKEGFQKVFSSPYHKSPTILSIDKCL